MQLAIGIVAALLAGWFFGCIITYKVGNRILVEGMGIKSAEFIMLVLMAREWRPIFAAGRLDDGSCSGCSCFGPLCNSFAIGIILSLVHRKKSCKAIMNAFGIRLHSFPKIKRELCLTYTTSFFTC